MEYKWLYKIKYAEHSKYNSEYENRYNSQSTYRYSFSVNNHPTFVVITPEILRLVSEIHQLDKKLYTLEHTLPALALKHFTKKCLVDEVQQTNELEGVASTRKEIKEVLENKSDKNNRLYGIVRKYLLLVKSGKVPLSYCQDVRNLYDEFLLQEIRKSNPENVPDGDIFRKNAVYVKDLSSGRVIHNGVFPETKIIETMSSLLSIQGNPKYNPLINIAVIHYMFGYIHPFYDGNGRMSRFISSYLLSQQLEMLVGFRLAYTIKQDIKKYYKMFKLTNEDANAGDLTLFTIYFLELVKSSQTELISHFTDKLTQLKFYQTKLDTLTEKSEIYRDTLFAIIQATMFGEDGISISELCSSIKKGDTTTRKVVKEIENDGFLKTKKTRPILYYADLEQFS